MSTFAWSTSNAFRVLDLALFINPSRLSVSSLPLYCLPFVRLYFHSPLRELSALLLRFYSLKTNKYSTRDQYQSTQRQETPGGHSRTRAILFYSDSMLELSYFAEQKKANPILATSIIVLSSFLYQATTGKANLTFSTSSP